MLTKVSRWGNSLGIRIPHWVAEQAQISDGATVEIDIKGDLILIRKKRGITLEEIAESITPENLHKEVDTGCAHGMEIC